MLNKNSDKAKYYDRITQLLLYIRYVLPKGKSFDPYTQEDFTLLANHINSTKRMQYGGKAPIELATSEAFRELLYVMGIHEIPADDVLLKTRLLRK